MSPAEHGSVRVVSVESVDGDPDGGWVGSAGMCAVAPGGSVSISSASTNQRRDRVEYLFSPEEILTEPTQGRLITEAKF